MMRKASSALGANLRGLLFSAWIMVWLELRARRLAIWRASRSCFKFSATMRIDWPSCSASSAGSFATKASSGRPALRANRRTKSVMAASSTRLTGAAPPEDAARTDADGSLAAASRLEGGVAGGGVAQGPSGSLAIQTGRRGLGSGGASGAGGSGLGGPCQLASSSLADAGAASHGDGSRLARGDGGGLGALGVQFASLVPDGGSHGAASRPARGEGGDGAG